MAVKLVPEKQAHKKRLAVWKNWLTQFKNQHPEPSSFKFIPHAAWLLNDMYWILAEEYIRDILIINSDEQEHRIHQYKIISVSEISVMMVLPIEIPAPKGITETENQKSERETKEKRINAGLAWFVATQIIESWKTAGTRVTKQHIEEVALFKENILLLSSDEKYPSSFAKEHLQWLSELNVANEKPLLLNAQCWRLFYLACLAIATKGKLIN